MMPLNDKYSLFTPSDIQKQLSSDVKRTRLEVKGWKRNTLAERSGVPYSTIKKFESSGEISLRQLLMLIHALGLLDRFNELLKAESEGMRLDDYIIQSKKKHRVRGSK
jgi:transcriptional regulator with XRE-family HTH domain